MQQWRVSFDADVTFVNGGGLHVQGFRLDIPGNDISDEELGALLVRHLGLLMVGEVHVASKTLIQEAHKGSREVAPQAPTSSQLVELSHSIRAGMVTYPGLPGPEITDHLSRVASQKIYSAGTEFQIGRISMVGNTGTYLDSPSHRYPDGADLSGLPLAKLADLDGIVVRIPTDVSAVDRLLLAPYDVAGRAVLIHTGWDRHWETETYGTGGHPHLTEDGAAWLASQGAALIGIDSVNIDDTSGGERPAHSTLLAAGIPIVEHMTGLDALPPHGFRFHAAPPLVAGMVSFPVRAYAIIAA
ncbi:MAG TPA: cyclase [Micromonosporaceae bacterium]|nr:cyclase [Micromonosporaceae bacterium]HCU48308.1 cyclase [Micromonosporaceae bacterium]